MPYGLDSPAASHPVGSTPQKRPGGQQIDCERRQWGQQRQPRQLQWKCRGDHAGERESHGSDQRRSADTVQPGSAAGRVPQHQSTMAADNPDTAASVAAGSDSAITTTVSSTARVATGRNRVPATTATIADVAAIEDRHRAIRPPRPRPSGGRRPPTRCSPPAVRPGLMIASRQRSATIGDRAHRLVQGVIRPPGHDVDTDGAHVAIHRGPLQRPHPVHQRVLLSRRTGSLAERRPPPRRDRVCAGRSVTARIRCRAAWRKRRRSRPAEPLRAAPMSQWWFRIRRRPQARCRAPDRTDAGRCRRPASGAGDRRARRCRPDHRCAARSAPPARRRAQSARWIPSPGRPAADSHR